MPRRGPAHNAIISDTEKAPAGYSELLGLSLRTERRTSKRADKLRVKGKAVDADAFAEVLRMEPDGGPTNVRNTSSSHWKPHLGAASRCLVPFTAFSEASRDEEGRYRPAFALPGEPVAFFAGLYHPQWRGVRKIKSGWETCNLFGFLTTEPNAEVGAIHPKAMPVILTTEEEHDVWIRASWEEAKPTCPPLVPRS